MQQKTVRLKKTDDKRTLGTVVYKVTIIKKSEYALQLSDPTKVYDGNPVSVEVNGAYGYNVFNVPEEPTRLQTPATEFVTATGTGDTYKSTVYISRSGGFMSGYTYYVADLTMRWIVASTNSSGSNTTVQYILYVTTEKNGDNATLSDTGSFGMGWTVTYNNTTGSKTNPTLIDQDPNGNTAVKWLTATTGNNRHRIARGNNTDLGLAVTNTGTVTLYQGNNQIGTLFSIGDAEKLSNEPVNTKEDAKNAAKAAQTAKTIGKFYYEISESTGVTQALTVQTVSNRSGSTSNTATQQTVSPLHVSGTKTWTEVGYYESVGSYDPTKPGTPVSVPEDELEQTQLTWYQTHRYDGTALAEDQLLDGPPTDVGTYRVEGELYTQTYNACGSQVFTITPREVRVQQITNWLLYVKTQPAAGTLAITDPGAIVLENVVSGDDVSLSVDAANGKVYYNETGLNYAPDKITLENASLVGERAFNYYLHYDDGVHVRIFVFGQIALDVQGSTFRKTLEGSWRKYYPQSDGAPVGHPDNPRDPDYHSPAIDGVYRAHSEYVLARTVNHNSGARYAVDIEYGAMQFGYYRGVWDVNTLSVMDQDDSFWGGMDGQNNRIALINYSNAEVYYQISAKIKPFYAEIDNVRGIRAKIAPNADGDGEMATWTSVAAATPGDSAKYGSSGSGECYLFLSGVPQLQESSTYTEIGTITVTVSPTGGS